MATMITVYPTKASALKITHPSGNLKVGVGGSEWPLDGFTSRMLSDNILTRDQALGYTGSSDPPRSSNIRGAATMSSGGAGPKS